MMAGSTRRAVRRGDETRWRRDLGATLPWRGRVGARRTPSDYISFQLVEIAPPMIIRIGTSERDGTFWSQAHALKAIFERHAALAPVEVLESRSASTENAQRLDSGAIEFGFMASNWIGRAKNGEPPFARRLELAMAAPMNAGPLFFIVKASSPIRSFADLRGRRIALGPRESGMVQHAHVIFGALGGSLADVVPVYRDFAEGAQALAKGEVDAQFQCPIPNRVMTELAARVDLLVVAYAPA